ncbi:5504_t:CDS:2, partial [Funneliformis caledonium]
GIIATSQIESMNACLKRLLYNSNITICDLVKEIHVLLDRHDKENEYNFWQLSIPSIKNQEKVNFLFTKVDQCLQQFLGPTMLKMHRDEINQSLYYIANLVNQEEANEKFPNEVSNKAEAIDLLQVTLEQMIKFVGYHNITEICKELDRSKELFLVADKFLQENENITSSHNGSVLFLSNFDQTGKNIYEERLGVLEQKLIYGKLHRIYKKALQKALQNNHKMQQLIELLQEFAKEEDSNDLSDPKEVLQDNNTSDKENKDPAMVTL